MDIMHQIRKILDREVPDTEDFESSKCDKCEEIESLIEVYGWEVMQSALVEMLKEINLNIYDFDVVAQVFWGAVLDKRIIDTNKVIALLYLRLPDGNDLENLIWSITERLKGVGYLSDYEPLEDPDIIKEMNKYK